jgi:hypothetical protein
MSNSYFDLPNDGAVRPFSRARAEEVRTIFAMVQDGFDKLPEPDLIQQGRITDVTDTGSTNVLSGDLASPPTELVTGIVVTITPAATNTGSATFNLNGLGARPLVNTDGSAVIAGQVVAGVAVQIRYEGAAWRILTGTYPVPGPTGPANSTYSARTKVASANPANLSAILTPLDIAGVFTWQTGDFSLQVAIDTHQAIYIASILVPVTQGCWVRRFSGAAQAVWGGFSETASAAYNSEAIGQLLRLARVVELPAGWFLWNGVPFDVPGSTIFGQGMNLTVLVASNSAHVYPNTGTGYRIRDLELFTTGTGALAGMVGSYHQDVSDFRIERVRFRATAACTTNAFTIVADFSPVGWSDIHLTDCEFINAGGMGVELQSHGSNPNRYSFQRVFIERCKIENPGRNPAFNDRSMCISVSGFSRDVVVKSCTLSGAANVGLEMIHTQSMLVADNTFASMTGSLISVTNTTQESGHKIVGSRMIGVSGNKVEFHSLYNSLVDGNDFFVVNAVETKGSGNDIRNNRILSLTGNGLVIEGFVPPTGPVTQGQVNNVQGNTISAAGPIVLFLGGAAANLVTNNTLICTTPDASPEDASRYYNDTNPGGKNLAIGNWRRAGGATPKYEYPVAPTATPAT